MAPRFFIARHAATMRAIDAMPLLMLLFLLPRADAC
jgi:hypothetical protein